MSAAECARIGILRPPPSREATLAAALAWQLRLHWMVRTGGSVGSSAFYFGAFGHTLIAGLTPEERIARLHIATRRHHKDRLRQSRFGLLNKMPLGCFAQECVTPACQQWLSDEAHGGLGADSIHIFTLRELFTMLEDAGEDTPPLSGLTAGIIDALNDIRCCRGGPSAGICNFVLNASVAGKAFDTGGVLADLRDIVFYGIRYRPCPHPRLDENDALHACCADGKFSYVSGPSFDFETTWAARGTLPATEETSARHCLCGQLSTGGAAACECLDGWLWR